MKDLAKSGWVDCTLGDVLALVRNGLNCKQNKDGVGAAISRIETIATGEFNLEKVGYSEISKQDREKFLLRRGDILFNHINSPPHIGKSAILHEDADLIHGVNLMLFRPFEKVDPSFLQLFLNTLYVSGYWRGMCKQSVNQASVNQKDIKKVPFSYPPLEEQQRIVAVLDEAFEGLARARAHVEANLQNARELFESYLANVFGGGDWQEKTLDQTSENLDRVRVPITKSKRVAGDIPYYGASGVVDHVADYLFDEDLLLISEDGANLLARTYPIAFSISGKSWVNNHAHVLRFDDPDTQEFVRLYLNSISLEPYVSGMAQPKLNQKQLNRIPIPFPDDDVRTEIVSRAHAISEETQRLERNFEAALQDLDELRQSLLQKAFAGELA